MIKSMTNLQLKKLANKITKKYFGKSLDCSITFDGRLRTTGGYFRCFRRSLADKYHYYIVINPKLLGYNKKDFIGTVKHELVHWYLFKQDPVYNHHHDNLFKAVDHKIGGMRYCPIVYSKNHMFWIYQCQSCGHTFAQSHRFNVKRYRCANKVKCWYGKRTCKGNFKCLGQISKASLQKKNNKMVRAERNFKRKLHTKNKYYNALGKALGYDEPNVREASESANIMERKMLPYLLKLLKPMSKTAKSHMEKVFHDNNYYNVSQAKLLIQTQNHDERFVDVDDKRALKLISKMSLPYFYIHYDGEPLGWNITGLDDGDILDFLQEFTDNNYTNGIKLYKAMIKFVKTHNCKSKVKVNS